MYTLYLLEIYHEVNEDNQYPKAASKWVFSNNELRTVFVVVLTWSLTDKIKINVALAVL